MADDDKKDERPRPKFGELAPEGWVWNPPKDSDRLDTSRPAADVTESPNPETVAQDAATADAVKLDALTRASGARPVPSWNQPVTLILLLVGIIGLIVSIGTISAIPESMQLVYTNEHLGTYKPGPSVAGVMLAGQIAMVVIWLGSAAISVYRLVRRRLTFFVPIIAGIVAFIALFICVSAIIASDSTLIDFYSKLSG